MILSPPGAPENWVVLQKRSFPTEEYKFHAEKYVFLPADKYGLSRTSLQEIAGGFQGSRIKNATFARSFGEGDARRGNR